jgi:hypothetical protein
MNELTRTLREIHARLDLPQPARSRVILEIAQDIRGMEGELIGAGMAPDQARRAALERCDLSDEAIAELVRVHAPPYRRFLDRLGAQARTRWERGLLVLACVIIALASGRMATSADVFGAGGVVAWLACAVAAVAVALGAVRVYAAFLAQDHDPARLRRGHALLPVLAAYNVFLAAVGAWGGFYRLAWGCVADPSRAVVLLTGWLRATSAATVVCLLSAIMIAALWYLLENKIAGIEQAEASVLLGQEV